MPDREMSREEAIEIVAEALMEVRDYAEENQVYVCLETHDFFSRADTASQAVKLADSPFIRINWDIMHPFTEGMGIEEVFEEVRELVEHCHIHDGTYDEHRKPTLALMGEGEIPYKTALSLLKKIDYEGYLSGEYISAWKPEVVLPHDIRLLKSYL